MATFSQLLINTFGTAGIYVLMGIGLSLIYRISGVFHFAHGAVYTLAPYLFFTLMVTLKIPMLVSFVLATGVAALVGLGIDRAVYQPLSKRSVNSATFLIASLGVYVVLVSLISAIYGTEIRILLPGVQKTFSVMGATVTPVQVAKIALLLLAVFVALWVRRTPIGLWFRSAADNPVMARAIGVRVTTIRRTAFLAGSGLAGLAGCLAALDTGAEPTMGMKALFVGIVSVFVGGPDIFLGPILGAVLFSALQVGANYGLSSRWESTVAFVVLLLFMAFRPEGILGRTRRVEETTVH